MYSVQYGYHTHKLWIAQYGVHAPDFCMAICVAISRLNYRYICKHTNGHAEIRGVYSVLRYPELVTGVLNENEMYNSGMYIYRKLTVPLNVKGQLHPPALSFVKHSAVVHLVASTYKYIYNSAEI
jgi:hypothetical protein